MHALNFAQMLTRLHYALASKVMYPVPSRIDAGDSRCCIEFTNHKKVSAVWMISPLESTLYVYFEGDNYEYKFDIDYDYFTLAGG